MLSIMMLSIMMGAVPVAAKPLAQDVREAAKLGRADMVRSAVVLAIANNPQAVETIIADAVTEAPAYREIIVAAASEAYPVFAERIERAAGEPAAVAVAGTVDTVPAAVPQAPQIGWTGEIALGGSRNTGNTETSDFNAAANAIRKGEHWDHEVRAEFAYSADGGKATAQRWLANYQPRYKLSERWYAFAFVQYLDDRFSGFSYEVSENVGLGYRILKDGPVTLSVEAGPGARHSEVAETGERINELTTRGAVKLGWTISDNAQFTNETVTTIGEERTVTKNVSSITANLVRNWALRGSFELRHNSSPPAGSKDLDTTTKGSLVYKF